MTAVLWRSRHLASPSPTPPGTRIDAQLAAWRGLDERARDALIHSAEALGPR
jgi:hypothetical protein